MFICSAYFFSFSVYSVKNGEIVESGSHDELMAKGGKYAYMFNLQAEKYKEADEN